MDTNIIISFLFRTDKSERAREILEASSGPVTTLSILEEVAYVGLSLIYGCRGFKLRDELRKELTSEAKIFLERVKSFQSSSTDYCQTMLRSLQPAGITG